MSDYLVKCCRCRNKHLESERLEKQSRQWSFAKDLVCPRCECTAYYQLEEVNTVEAARGGK
ncbi:hypothetical protein QLH32_05690 [Acinetobacter corruptisaponis]|uniref:Uncharacterized protein n=1 Tax=Acinetobacter corruptisaponis TaxID=3045147 RepID=A0ABY8S5H5_9GAMM|nr:hypothetical protein [Acinetobacter sp. KCTC 92772]WHP06958.1 hypothetical protein QLH32_05690 [Acinetobacter sp. KCTC 92772]